jgi:hypothetical protein
MCIIVFTGNWSIFWARWIQFTSWYPVSLWAVPLLKSHVPNLIIIFCRWGSSKESIGSEKLRNISQHQKYSLLWYEGVQSYTNLPMFRRKLLLPSSGSNTKSCKQRARSMQRAESSSC